MGAEGPLAECLCHPYLYSRMRVPRGTGGLTSMVAQCRCIFLHLPPPPPHILYRPFHSHTYIQSSYAAESRLDINIEFLPLSQHLLLPSRTIPGIFSLPDRRRDNRSAVRISSGHLPPPPVRSPHRKLDG